MSTGSQRRTRSDLIAGLSPPWRAARWLVRARSAEVLKRAGLCLLAALAMWGTTGAWNPPFGFRAGDTPRRNIVANAAFSVDNDEETQSLRRRARATTLCIYENDKLPLVELRRALKDSVFRVTSAESLDKLDAEAQKTWADFLLPDHRGSREMSEPLYQSLLAALVADKDLARFSKALELAFADFERQGLLVALEHDLEDGSQTAILVHDVGRGDFAERVEVSDVHLAAAMTRLQNRLLAQFQAQGLPAEQLAPLSQLVTNWIGTKKLPTTLRLNKEASAAARKDAESKVPTATRKYNPGDLLAVAGRPLAETDVLLLRREYEASLAQRTLLDKVQRSFAGLGLYLALYVLCGWYLVANEPRLVTDTRRLANLLALAVATVTLCAFDNNFQWRADVIPLIIFGTTVAIAYHAELALLLSACLSLVVSISLGYGLGRFVVVMAAVSASALLVGRIRTRTRLLYVGLGSGFVVTVTAIAVGTLVGGTFGWSGIGQAPLDELNQLMPESFLLRLVMGALWLGLCAVVAGLLMTGLLPFVERLFDVQTDLSLLELGDPAHPLLQQLVQRAPGTYNHSITVASIGQAAAEAIGANGLLVRVGAYFHDIGKMLKPDYFVENQAAGDNRHATLMPAMSTLVIIAHVKDGGDLARKHRLPQPIINFVEQHHGTTLVEFFFDRANRQSQEGPHSSRVDETSYRYPGPKPQTQEAAVLMLADVAEGACRALPDPAPARIRNLVHDLAMKRLLDGQFDESGLTLKQLRTIEESLAKSLTSVYHGRVKYPNQQTA